MYEQSIESVRLDEIRRHKKYRYFRKSAIYVYARRRSMDSDIIIYDGIGDVIEIRNKYGRKKRAGGNSDNR